MNAPTPTFRHKSDIAGVILKIANGAKAYVGQCELIAFFGG